MSPLQAGTAADLALEKDLTLVHATCHAMVALAFLVSAGGGEEVAAAVPGLGLRDVDQPQVRLMHQRRGVESLPWFLVGQFLGRQAAQLGVDQRRQLLGGVAVAVFEGRQDRRDLAPRREDTPGGRVVPAAGDARRSRRTEKPAAGGVPGDAQGIRDEPLRANRRATRGERAALGGGPSALWLRVGGHGPEPGARLGCPADAAHVLHIRAVARHNARVDGPRAVCSNSGVVQ